MTSISEHSMRYSRRNNRPHLVLGAETFFERGKQRAKLLGAELLGGIEAYDVLFHTAGLKEETIRSAAQRVIDSVGAWRPRIIEELTGISHEAGVELWRIAGLNARTELLGMAISGTPGECSALVYIPPEQSSDQARSPFGVQTWDWNEELNDYWHTQVVTGGKHAFVGVTEHGILAKVGINNSGLSVFFNILAQEGDGVGGIPVHLLAATVLEEAGTVEEAIELLEQAHLKSSTALTVVDTRRAVSVELSPSGIFHVEPQDGYLLHTNHFLSDGGRTRERALYHPDSQNRHALVSARLKTYGKPSVPEHLVEFLYSDPDQAHLCCLPASDAKLGRRWRTLATILLDPKNATASVLDGSPVEQRRRTWLHMKA